MRVLIAGSTRLPIPLAKFDRPGILPAVPEQQLVRVREAGA